MPTTRTSSGSMSKPAARPQTRRSVISCCQRNLPSSGYAQDGDQWKCLCGMLWVHVCDEAEGCYWRPFLLRAIKPRKQRASIAGAREKL